MIITCVLNSERGVGAAASVEWLLKCIILMKGSSRSSGASSGKREEVALFGVGIEQLC